MLKSQKNYDQKIVLKMKGDKYFKLEKIYQRKGKEI